MQLNCFFKAHIVTNQISTHLFSLHVYLGLRLCGNSIWSEWKLPVIEYLMCSSCVITIGDLLVLLPNEFKQVIFLPFNRWENWGSNWIRDYQIHCSRCCRCFADMDPVTIFAHIDSLCAFTPNNQHLCLCWLPGAARVILICTWRTDSV